MSQRNELRFIYRSWRGEVAERRVDPRAVMLHFGATSWHPKPQWLIRFWDLDKEAIRDFAWKDIISTTPAIEMRGSGAEGGQGAVAIKALEWRAPVQHGPSRISGDKGGVSVKAESVVGEWSVASFDGNMTYRVLGYIIPGDNLSFDTVEAAKAYAQARFEDRVRSCLSPAEGQDAEARLRAAPHRDPEEPANGTNL